MFPQPGGVFMCFKIGEHGELLLCRFTVSSLIRLKFFLQSVTHLNIFKRRLKRPTLNSPLPPLTSLIISLHNTPSGPGLKRTSKEGSGGVESIQLSVNLAQAREPLTPQPSCYQLKLTPTQSDAIILLQRLY